MRKPFIFIVTLLLFCMIHISCQKEEDENIPTIEFLIPNTNENYNVLDTVKIIANVKDDKKLVAIEVVIVNTYYAPVTDKLFYTPNSTEFHINTEISIDNIHLNSGTYYIKIRAFDGVNEKNLFRAININSFPREFKKIIAITKVHPLLYNVFSIDTGITQLFNYSGDYISSAINNNFQQLYLCGKVNSDFNCYNLNSNTLDWSFPPDMNPPFPSFENLYFNNNLVYLSGSQAYITAFNRFSNTNFTAATTNGYTPYVTFRYKDYLIVDEKCNTSEMRYLSLYFYPTGALKNSTFHSTKIKAFEIKDNDEIYFFGNDASNKAVMSWYNIDNQAIYSPHSMPVDQLKDIARITNNDILLSIGNTVYWYQENSNSLTPFIQQINAEKMVYEDISQTVIISEGNKLLYYKFPSANKTGEQILSNSISKIHLLYSKEKQQ